MALTKEELKDISEALGKETAEKIQGEMKTLEKALHDKQVEVTKGLLTEEAFKAFKEDSMEPINKELKKLDEIGKKQGDELNKLIELGKAAPGQTKSLEKFIEDLGPEIKKMRDNGGFATFTGQQLKDAGVYSIAGTIPTPSPYAPGIGGAPLEIFDIMRNPNFITSRVDMGRTNQSKLAWINEIDYQGSPAKVAEAGLKPLTQHMFNIELSTAQKIAAYIKITEELDEDLPQLGTLARRMLQDDVERYFDDQIQIDVQTAARPFNITGLNGKVQAANLWDALYAEWGQVGFYNFIANTVALNALTDVLVNTQKNVNNTYLLPPFADKINGLMVQANKMAVGFGLVGDLKQYHVDIYKDFYLKVGWINDDLIHNQFAIVGEMRYHSYISDARKNAIVYDDLSVIDAAITV